MLRPVVVGKIKSVLVTDTILDFEVEKVLMGERTWLLGKLANIYRHPRALGPHQACT